MPLSIAELAVKEAGLRVMWVGQPGVARVKTFEQLDAWLGRQLH